MDWSVVLSVVIVVIGAVVGIIKREKIKQTAEIAKVGMESIAASLSDTDDTPGKITPAEWAEAVEAMAGKAKEIIKDA